MIEKVQMAKVKLGSDGLVVVLPLTRPSGKVRLKRRNSFYEYGEPFAARKKKIGLDVYVEWQIGYDLLAKSESDVRENALKTSLNQWTFQNYQNVPKFAYELSEILFYAVQSGLINKTEIVELRKRIEAVTDEELIEDRRIKRTNPVETTVGGLGFYEMEVSYPLLVHKFGEYDIYAEVINREKQRAIGVQPMLYVCLPITALEFAEPVLGRTLEAKECAEWRIGQKEARLAIELFRVFGMLSKKHRFDVLAILDLLFGD